MSNFQKILRFVAPYKNRLLLSILLTVVATFLGLVPPMVVKVVVDRVVEGRQWDLLEAVLVISILVPLTTALVGFLNSFNMAYIGQRIVFDVRLKMYEHLMRLSMRFHEGQGTGKILSRLMGDVATVQRMTTNRTITMVTNLIASLFSVLAVFYLNWKMALILMAILPFYTLNYSFFIARIRRANLAFRRKMDKIAADLQENLSGTMLVKAFHQEKSETREFLEDARDSLNLAMTGSVYSVSFSTTSRILTGMGITVLFCLGCYFVIKGQMTYGSVTAFMAYAMRLFNPVVQFTEIADRIGRMMVSVNRIFEIMDAVPDIQERKDAVSLPPATGHVRFDHIWFEYIPGEPVLKDICLDVLPGTTVALVGHTGCGKTTLTSLLLRYYDVKSGGIYIDEYNIADVTLRSLRGQIGQVLQDSVLFNTTIKENIRYGRRDGTDEEIVQAAMIAEIHDFIMRNPEGYDTVIGEEGIKLSVGEKQRMAIARAVLADPAILVLDEATSSLDTESELLIQKALENVMAHRTSFVIAHRLSTIVHADVIIVMDRGEIVEQGPHLELLEKEDGLYRRLYEQQYAHAQLSPVTAEGTT